MAKTGSARRHRQGPQAARMRGRSEATSLARCRAQIEHRLRDGRRIHRSRARCHVAHAEADNARASRTRLIRLHQSGAERVPFGDPNFPHERDQIVRTKWATIGATSATQITARLDAEQRPHRQRHRHRQPWRERPLRTRAGPLEARAPGSLTPWFPALIAAAAPAVGGKERRPFVRSASRARARTCGC